MKDVEADYTDLIAQIEVSWLSKGKGFGKSLDQMEVIKEFLKSREEHYAHCDEKFWLMDFFFHLCKVKPEQFEPGTLWEK